MKAQRNCLLLCFLSGFLFANQEPRLFVKFPTRSRPQRFFAMLDLYYQKLSKKIPYQFLVSIDEDDKSMNNNQVLERLKKYPHLDVLCCNHLSKIDACNRGIENYDFDILLLASDDMEPILDGYDLIIADVMRTYFPDYDGVTRFHDGFVDNRCNTLPIMGKKFYDRFKYVYHPAYLSLVCDLELAIVAKALKKEVYINKVIIR
ncbi:hypothetical protein CVU75_00935, partial [Candidatus Dependentiae bacterium HGW-Dependentiae-1]